MAALILINGAPGTGKSTLARRYADEHPLTVAVDIDLVRSLVGGWREHATDAGMLARRMALAMIGAALADGRDVVVPQLLGRPDFVATLAALASDLSVPFVEIVITTPAGTAERRFRARSAATAHDHQVAVADRDPAELVAGYEAAIRAVADGRPQTIMIDNPDGAEDAAYATVVATVEAARIAKLPRDSPVPD